VYLKKYTKKEEFVKAIMNWVPNTSKEKALLSDVVKRFNVMPPMPIEKEDLKKIAETLYNRKFLMKK